MATRNVTGSQVRQSMATSGSALKSRQLVSLCPQRRLLPLTFLRKTGTAQLATRPAFGQSLRYREPTTHDQCAGGGDEGVGQLAWRAVSVDRPKPVFKSVAYDDRFMAASKVLGEESVKEAGQPGK